ncbi:Uncharacterized protein APZ42_017562 [Daphnia magna]|uniref:Uncharacterized protein n=1 Tax=Daphnia magna TaxID=35525 RepID=A0A164ZY68_9CRUS|nr:Uncharacterized protein APZ42_017562 [Daphnia magna]
MMLSDCTEWEIPSWEFQPLGNALGWKTNYKCWRTRRHQQAVAYLYSKETLSSVLQNDEQDAGRPHCRYGFDELLCPSNLWISWIWSYWNRSWLRNRPSWFWWSVSQRSRHF